LYWRFRPSYIVIAVPKSDMFRGSKPNSDWGEAQKAAFFKKPLILTSGKTSIQRYYDLEWLALLVTDVSDIAVRGILSQLIEEGKIHEAGFLYRWMTPAELNSIVVFKKMLGKIDSLKKWRHFLHEAVHTTIRYSLHPNSTYFKSATNYDQSQAWWSQQQKSRNFDLYYLKCLSNGKNKVLSRCSEFTSRTGGTTAAGNQMLLKKEQWLEVGPMQIKDDECDSINVRVLDNRVTISKSYWKI